MTTTTTEPKAGTQILAAIHEMHRDLIRHVDRTLNPADLRFYRASVKDIATGKALKVDLRITPGYSEAGFLDRKTTTGGVFVEIVPQATIKSRGTDATFDWESDQKVIAKLGVVDLTAILLSIESRWFRMKLPDRILAKDRDGTVKPGTVAMVHKFEARGDRPATTKAIEYAIRDDSSSSILIAQTSPAVIRKDFVLSLAEEIQLRAYLQRALGAMLSVGL